MKSTVELTVTQVSCRRPDMAMPQASSARVNRMPPWGWPQRFMLSHVRCSSTRERPSPISVISI